MKRQRLNSLVACGAAACAMTPCTAQIAYFDDVTDTIRVDGQTVLGNTWTVEMRVMLSFDQVRGGGRGYNEYTSRYEDKILSFRKDHIFAASYPRPAISSPLTLTPRAWHHVAYVYDGTEQRIYLDGAAVLERATTGGIGDGNGHPVIGAIQRDGTVRPSLLGYLDYVHVSSISRYSGATISPPIGSPVADADTLILFNFDDSAGSTQFLDEGPSGFVGLLGVGFGIASKPDIVCGPADCNRDTELDIFDFLCWQGLFVTADPFACDCDTSTGANVCDIFDFLCFQNEFVTGCP